MFGYRPTPAPSATPLHHIAGTCRTAKEIENFLSEIDETIATTFAKTVDNRDLLPLNLLAQNPLLNSSERNKALTLLMPLTIRHDFQPLSAPISLDHILKENPDAKDNPTLLNHLKLAHQAATYARQIIKRSSTHPVQKDHAEATIMDLQKEIDQANQEIELKKQEILKSFRKHYPNTQLFHPTTKQILEEKLVSTILLRWIEGASEILEKYQVGNCYHFAYPALKYLWRNSRSYSTLCQIRNGNHSFVIINIDNPENNEPIQVICDPWSGYIGKLTAPSTQLRTLKGINFTINNEKSTYNISTSFNPHIHSLANSDMFIDLDQQFNSLVLEELSFLRKSNALSQDVKEKLNHSYKSMTDIKHHMSYLFDNNNGFCNYNFNFATALEYLDYVDDKIKLVIPLLVNAAMKNDTQIFNIPYLLTHFSDCPNLFCVAIAYDSKKFVERAIKEKLLTAHDILLGLCIAVEKDDPEFIDFIIKLANQNEIGIEQLASASDETSDGRSVNASPVHSAVNLNRVACLNILLANGLGRMVGSNFYYSNMSNFLKLRSEDNPALIRALIIDNVDLKPYKNEKQPLEIARELFKEEKNPDLRQKYNEDIKMLSNPNSVRELYCEQTIPPIILGLMPIENFSIDLIKIVLRYLHCLSDQYVVDKLDSSVKNIANSTITPGITFLHPRTLPNIPTNTAASSSNSLRPGRKP